MRVIFQCICGEYRSHQQDIGNCGFCKKEVCPKCRHMVKIDYGDGYVRWPNMCLKCYEDKDFLIKNEISREKIEKLAYVRSERYQQDLKLGGRIVKID